MMGFTIPAALTSMIVMAMRGGPKDEDEDGEYIDDALASLFGGQFKSAMGLIPGGQVLNAAVNVWNKNPYDDRLSTSPAIAAIEAAVKAPYSVYQAIAGEDSRSTRRTENALEDTLTLLGILTGLPFGAAAKPAKYLSSYAEGDVEPTGPFDFTRGILSGR